MSILTIVTLCFILGIVGNIELLRQDESNNHNKTLSDIFSIYHRKMTLTLIHDPKNVEMASEVSFLLRTHPQMMFTYHQVHTALVPVMENLMEHASLEQMRDQLQFLVVCELTCVERLFEEVGRLDIVVGQGSLLRHFSTWLIISPDDLHALKTGFDNVAWIRLIDEDSLMQDHIENIYTLLWMPGGRNWSHIDFRISNSYINIFPNFKRGLNGRELAITTLEWAGYADRKIVDGKVTYTGASMDIVDNLKRKFNFSYVIAEPKDGLWGKQFENGTITGVIGMIHRKETQFCPSPYAISLTWSMIMDFSTTLGSSDFIFVYKRRMDVSSSWLFLILNFSWPVYLCGASSLVWMVSWLFVLNLREQRSTWFDIIFRVPFHQDLHVVPTSMSSRIMLFTWAMFCLMFAAVYTSNLVSRYAVAENASSINTIEELAERTDLQIVIQEGLVVESILKKSNNSAYQRLSERLVVVHSLENEPLDEKIDQILNGPFVALVTTEMKNKMSSKACNLVEVRERIFSTRLGLAYPKHSPLRNLFDKQIGQLVGMGICDHLIHKHLPKRKECETAVRQTQFKMKYLKSVLIVTGCGILVASSVLLLERTKLRPCNNRH